MSDQKISGLLALSLFTSPMAIHSSIQPEPTFATSPIKNSTLSASIRKMKHLLEVPPVLEPMGTYVGELHEKWEFPSDHLPIGMSLDSLNIVSWNVLDAEYMDWVIEKNSQGLQRSMIADEHVYIGDSELTIRDKHVAQMVLEMITHPSHPRGILSLQECSQAFLEELRTVIPAHFEIISSHGDSILIDKQSFEIVEAKEISEVFSDAPYRTFQDIQIRRLDNGQLMRLINIHLPGDPTKPGRYEFANYLSKTFDPAVTTIAMGDMNFNEIEMAHAIGESFQKGSPFSIHSPYCTNISPYVFQSKAIDHFIVYTPNLTPVTLSAPDELTSNLAKIVALLEGLSNS